jgi:glucose-1-phosphate thymidylyltransferase
MSLIEDAVGLVPAAGRASRLGNLAGSKELLPLGFRGAGPGGEMEVRPVCASLFDAFRESGIRQALVVLRQGKWDIPDYLGDGRRFGVDVSYAMMRHPYGAPFTLDAAYPFVRDVPVALGFPDILFRPPDAFRRLFDRLEESDADVALGLFPAYRPESTDMVACDARGRILDIEVKPAVTDRTHAWGLAVWRPRFTAFLHLWVQRRLLDSRAVPLEHSESYVGQVFLDALAEGLHFEGLVVSDEPFLDIGTPASLAEAWRRAGEL